VTLCIHSLLVFLKLNDTSFLARKQPKAGIQLSGCA
jgi:hypothetical protein